MAVVDPPSLRKALGFYEQAVALDPGFAQAWAQISRASAHLYDVSDPTPDLAERARQAAEKAVALAPNRPEGYLALGNYQSVGPRVTSPARWSSTPGVSASRPATPTSSRRPRSRRVALGRWEAAVEHLQQAERLDPRSVLTHSRSRRGAPLPAAVRRGTRGRRPGPRPRARHLYLIELQGHDVSRRGRSGRSTGRSQGRAKGGRAHRARGLRGELLATSSGCSTRSSVSCSCASRRARSTTTRGIWGFCLAQAYALKGDAANVRTYAEEARKAFEEQLRAAPEDCAASRPRSASRWRTWGERKKPSGRESAASRSLPVTKNAYRGPLSSSTSSRGSTSSSASRKRRSTSSSRS